jgi:hypothetical protein
LGACLTYRSASVAAFSESAAQSLAGLVGLILLAPCVWTLRTLWQRARDPDAQVLPWSLYMVTFCLLLETGLLLTAIAAIAEGWPLVTCLSVELLQGL